MTYSATVGATADLSVGVVEVTSTVVAALIAETRANNLDLEVEVSVGGGLVLEHGQVGGAISVADTEVHGSPVTGDLRAGAPLATLLGGNTLVVDVVLSGGRLALPVEVGGAVGAGQFVGTTCGGGKRNGLRLSTGVISTANSNIAAQLVADVDVTSTLDTERFTKLGVGEVELATLTLETTNGLAGGSLGRGPLVLLVTGRASVRAHATVGAALAGNGGNNVADKLVNDANVLNTGPTTQAKVVKGDGTVGGGEVGTVDLSIGEVGINASGTGASGGRGDGGGARGRAGSGGGGRGHSAGRAGAGAGAGDHSGGLDEHLGGESRGGSRGGSRSGGRGRGRGASSASSGDSITVPLKRVVVKLITGFLVADLLNLSGVSRVENDEFVGSGTGDNSSVNLGLNGTLVEASMAMTTVGGRQGTRRGEGQSKRVLHCDSRVSNCEAANSQWVSFEELNANVEDGLGWMWEDVEGVERNAPPRETILSHVPPPCHHIDPTKPVAVVRLLVCFPSLLSC